MEEKNERLISIIVPVYNTEKFLEKCVESLLNQTYKNLEIILVDDGSKDSSPVICDKLKEKDSRIKVIHKENGGVSSARNIALDVCEGEYVSFIDSDDYLDLNTYNDLNNILEQHNVDVIKFSIQVFYGGHPVKPYYYKTIPDTVIKKEDFKSMVYNNIFTSADFCSMTTALIRTEILKQYNFKFDPKIKYAEDFSYMFNVLTKIETLYVTNKCYYQCIMNNGSATSNLKSEAILKKIHDETNVALSISYIVGFKKDCQQRIDSKILEGIKNLANKNNYKNYKISINEIENSNYYKDYINYFEDTYDFNAKRKLSTFVLYKIINIIKNILKFILKV